MGVLRRVLRYVQGTLDYGNDYAKQQSTILVGFCDVDWVRSEDDSKNTSGYAYGFGSGVFLWASMKQNILTLSTTEVEYVSPSKATAQAI